jgi:murein DD-endopeptidase MepM/ murein hydrolase activator NlpD
VLTVVILALPLVTTPAVAPIPAGGAEGVALATAVTTQPTLGPHGDDVAVSAADKIDPPIDRSIIHRATVRLPAFLSGYQWPLQHGRITNRFGKGAPGAFMIDGVTAHDGLDLSTFCGDRILAAHDGVVLTAGRHHQPFMGWIGDLAAFTAKLDADHAWYSQAIAVVIDDGNGYRSVYVHLSKALVHAGDTVTAGQLIGYEGATGNATGCHLHYSLFSPQETAFWLLEPRIVQHSLLPDREIARIDPLLVMPPLSAAGITWSWGVAPQEQ